MAMTEMILQILTSHIHTRTQTHKWLISVLLWLSSEYFWPLWIICNKFYYIINSTENCKTLKITRSICLHSLPFSQRARKWKRTAPPSVCKCDVSGAWFYENSDDFCPFSDYAIQINAFTSLSFLFRMRINYIRWYRRCVLASDWQLWMGVWAEA